MSWLDKDDQLIGNNGLEDVRWLASLSDSELEVLVSLKKLIIQRAKVIGHESIVDKFDLKMLRALGFVMMEYFKDRLIESPVISGVDAATFKDGCNLSNLSQEGASSVHTEDVRALIDIDSRKRMAKGTLCCGPSIEAARDEKKQKRDEE